MRQYPNVAPQTRDKKSQREGKVCWKKKIHLIIEKSNGTKTDIYHHVIDQD